MKNFILLFITCLAVNYSANAQGSVDSPNAPAGEPSYEHVYDKQSAQERKVVPYAHLREADVHWAKRIWRTIDLHEKINAPLRYPLEGVELQSQTLDRNNLILTLYNAINEGSLQAYKSDKFEKMTNEEFKAKFAGDTIYNEVPVDLNDPGGQTRIDTVISKITTDKVMRYQLKEEWFIDKQRSVMDVRIIGLSPIIEIEKGGEIVPVNMFWVYFPEARNVLVHGEVGNRANSAQRLTFDDLFMKRMFNSYINKEENIYDRTVTEYRNNPLDQLLESEKIKQGMINEEIGLWDY